MDRARKSLTSLRQAASLKSPPAAPKQASAISSAASLAPDDFNRESSNPMFNEVDPELARAAAPSGKSMEAAMRRAAAPSTSSSVDPELVRAAAPSFAAGSERGSVRSNLSRVANEPAPVVVGNPILAQEFSKMNHPASPASPLSLSASTHLSSDADDPTMNKATLSKTKSMSSRMLSRSKSAILRPARFIKEKTWGTPRRRMCTSLCLVVSFIIFIYLVVRLVDTLKILNSSPSVSEFEVADLCSNTFALTVSGSLLNPSGTGATINPMRSEIWLGNSTSPNGMHLLGYVDTPSIFVSAGNGSLALAIQVEIPIEQAPWVRQVLQDYVAERDVLITAKIPLSASFAASVFIFPITYSTSLEFQFTLPRMNSSSSNSTDPKPSLIQDVELTKPRDPLNYLTARLGLQLWTQKDFEKQYFEVTVPPIQFDVYLGDKYALTSSTSFLHYGKKLPDFMNPQDLGKVNLTGAVGTPNIAGVHFGLNQFKNKGMLPVRVVVNQTHPEITTYRLQNGDYCYAQKLLQNLTIEQTVDLGTVFDGAPETSTTVSPTPAPTAQPYFNLTTLEIADVNAQAIINTRFGVDLKGLSQFYNFRGWIPAVQVYIETDAVNGTAQGAPLVYVDLPASYFFYPNASYLPSVLFNLQLLSATQLSRVADKYLMNNNDVTVYIHTSATGSIASRLLSAYVLDFSIKELMGDASPSSSPVSRRVLASNGGNISPWANKSIVVDVQSGLRGFSGVLNASGFDTTFFSGTRLMWKKMDLKVYLDNGRGGWYPNEVLWFKTNGYDTNIINGHLNAEIGMGDDGSGNILRGMIQNITSFQKIHLRGSATYNNGPVFGDDFYFERTPDAANATRQGESSFSFFNLYHGELLTLSSNNFFTNIYFGLDFGELKINVNMPQIALAIGRCNEPYFISVVLDQWSFQTGGDAAFAPLQLELNNASKVLDALTTFANGTPQRVCLSGHPVLATNFLSYFLGALSIDLVIPGRNKTATPVGSGADLIDLTVTSLARQACVQLELNLTDSKQKPSNDSVSFGWGAVDMLWSVSYLGLPADFLQISVSQGWYGPIDAYRVATFYAPSAINPVTVKVCALADADRTLLDGQAATRGVVQSFYDGKYFDVTVGGTLKQRYPAGNNVVANISGQFRAPATAFNSLKSIGGTTAASDINATSWFELLELEIVAFNGNTFSSKITFETGGVGFNLTLPEIHARVGKLTVPGDRASEVKLFDLGMSLPSFGYADQLALPVSIDISLIPPQDWGDTLQLIDDLLTGVADIAIGSTTDPSATLLSQIIPTISFSLSKKDVVAPPTPGPDRLDVAISASSTPTSASILADFGVLERLDYKFIWGTIKAKLYDGAPGSSNEIGSIFVPGQVLQEVGTGPMGINVTLYGKATTFAQKLFNGSSLSIGFQGTIGTSMFSSSFKIPASITDSIALGKPGTNDEASSSFDIIDAAILGASNAGASGTVPCLFESACLKNLIRGDGQLNYSGITAGVTLAYNLPKFNRIRWNVALNSDAYVKVSANGYIIGQVVLRPLHVFSNQTLFSPVFSVLPNLAQIVELRSTITAVSNGYDTVFTLGGDDRENYLSQVLNAVQQDVSIVDVPPPDPNKPGLLGKLAMKIVSAIRNVAVVEASMPLTWNPKSLVISLGSLNVEVFFGHSKTCGPTNDQYCLNGYNVATAKTPAPLILNPNPIAQNLVVQATLHHSGGVLSAWQQAVDDLISRYIWSFEIPLQIQATITPPANNRYGYTTPFTLETFITLPAGVPNTGFIDAINVNIWGTLKSSIGDIKIQAQKVLKNTVDFPLVVSYYQYVLKLVDSDGVLAGQCLGLGGLMNSINPCSLLNLCYDPWPKPTPVGPLITSGDYSQVKPGTSILDNGQRLLMPGSTGSTGLTIDVTAETAARLVDEMMTKGVMCGEIGSGIMLVGLQADPNCQDSGKLEADLQCTFPIRVQFNLTNYPLSKNDTCGGQMEVPNYLGFNFYPTGLYQFNNVWSTANLQLNPGSSVVRLVAGGKQQAGRSDNVAFSVEDSFKLSFDYRAAGNGCLFMGEALALTFMTSPASAANFPQISLNCGFTGCDDRYAVNSIVGVTGPYASLVVAFYKCNSFSWVVNGNIAAPYRGSQSCAGGYIDDGNWGTVSVIYNANDHRATVSYSRSGQVTRSFDFDLDLKAQLGGRSMAYLAMTANTGSGGITGSCAIVEYSNIVHEGPRTNGAKSTLEGPLTLVRAGEVGLVKFRARDENGRKRGRGGNTWLVKILDAVSGLPANQNSTINPRFVDNEDGTYSVRYQIFTRGRYNVQVACQAGAAPDICNNATQYVTLTSGLFVRA